MTSNIKSLRVWYGSLGGGVKMALANRGNYRPTPYQERMKQGLQQVAGLAPKYREYIRGGVWRLSWAFRDWYMPGRSIPAEVAYPAIQRYAESQGIRWAAYGKGGTGSGPNPFGITVSVPCLPNYERPSSSMLAWNNGTVAKIATALATGQMTAAHCREQGVQWSGYSRGPWGEGTNVGLPQHSRDPGLPVSLPLLADAMEEAGAPPDMCLCARQQNPIVLAWLLT